jgi:hypothetical protein
MTQAINQEVINMAVRAADIYCELCPDTAEMCRSALLSPYPQSVEIIERLLNHAAVVVEIVPGEQSGLAWAAADAMYLVHGALQGAPAEAIESLLSDLERDASSLQASAESPEPAPRVAVPGDICDPSFQLSNERE